MPDMPIGFDSQVVEVGGDDTDNSTGTVLTSGAANTLGSYATLIASTAYDSAFIGITLTDMNVGDVDMLINIAIGAAASEVVVIPNLYTGSGFGGNTYGGYYLFNLIIPIGSRISANVQSSGATDTVDCVIHLFAGSFAQPTQLQIVDTYGANTADSGGTAIDPGGTADTKGAYSQITASSTRDIKMLAIAIGNTANGSRSSFTWLLDIAIGAASSEVLKIENIPLVASSGSDVIVPQTMYMIPVSIPAGSRIAAAAQCSGTDATDRLFDVILYGIG